MNSSVARLDSLRSSPQFQTQLGRMCGSEELFHERYQIIRILGRGGFGVTFLARNVCLPGMPLCVIKQLCPKVNTPLMLQRSAQRFEREAKILGQLGSHPQIPRLLDYFEEEGEFYLVQEYIRGCTLGKEVKRKGPCSEYQVKQFLREILPVLDYVHQHHVIHRDIKPPNILRSHDDGRLVLIDFGAVKEQFVESDGITLRATTTHFVGTLGFAPPEQLALRTTYASDIFAVGVTCLYLLTGKPPMEFEFDAVTGEVKWQQDLSFVSDPFGQILDRMLRMSLRDRFQSVDDILRSIDREPYTADLASCMHLSSRSKTTVGSATLSTTTLSNATLSNATLSNATASTSALATEPYLTPSQRTAGEIRRWRTKLMRREKNGELHRSL